MLYESTDEVLSTVCGNSLPDIISSYSNEVDIVFQSGSRAYNRQGFRLSYNTSIEGKFSYRSVGTSRIGVVWHSLTATYFPLKGCGGELSGPSGTFQSPGYPNAYPHNRICIWKIRGPIGRRVTLTFTDFSLEEPGRIGSRTGLPDCHDFIYVNIYHDFIQFSLL